MKTDRDPPGDALDHVRSRAGTQITFLTTGAGSGEIVAPGVLTRARDFVPLANALAQSFTVHTIKRRGRSQSGPQGARYGMDGECEDVAAIQEATGSQRLFYHSYGGLIALESAKEARPFTKVAVYEPGFASGDPSRRPGHRPISRRSCGAGLWTLWPSSLSPRVQCRPVA